MNLSFVNIISPAYSFMLTMRCNFTCVHTKFTNKEATGVWLHKKIISSLFHGTFYIININFKREKKYINLYKYKIIAFRNNVSFLWNNVMEHTPWPIYDAFKQVKAKKYVHCLGNCPPPLVHWGVDKYDSFYMVLNYYLSIIMFTITDLLYISFKK